MVSPAVQSVPALRGKHGDNEEEVDVNLDLLNDDFTAWLRLGKRSLYLVP